MSFNLIELDVDFQTALPNRLERVNAGAEDGVLRDDQVFLLQETSEGRLENISALPEIPARVNPQAGEGGSEAGLVVLANIVANYPTEDPRVIEATNSAKDWLKQHQVSE